MNEPLNIQLSNRGQQESGSMGGAWLKLPATAEQLNAALARIGAQGGEQGKDFFITYRETPLFGLTRELVENANIDELNYMAARSKTLDAHETEKLNALSHTSFSFDSIKQFIEYADNHDFFVYIPEVTNNAELGDYYLHHSQMIQMPEEWKGAVNTEVLGALAATHERGQFCEYGYILESGDKWQEVYKGREDIPQEYRIIPKIENPAVEYDTISTRTAATLTAKPPAITAAPIVLVADNPRDKLKEITAKLEAGIKGIFDSEQYKSYLRTLSKFHNYSFNNCLLIAMQKPDASHIAGFNAWRDTFKRPVKKGEKGIKILAPAPFKTTKEVDRINADGKPVFDSTGRRAKDTVEITVPAFKVTTVFDVSQTDGEPLPQIGVNELTGSVDKYKDFFAALEKTSRVPIAFEAISGGAKGYYQQEEKRIAINEGMSELQNLKTAIHEIAHSRLHDIDKNAPATEPRPDRRTSEVEAESIAYTVCQHYGLDTSDYSFGYVATWSGDKQLDTLKSSLDTIRKEADAIISEVDKHFTELSQNREQTAERQPGFEQWSEPATPENAPDIPGVPSDDVSAYLPEQGDTFTIYQLRDGDETRNLRFETLAAVAAAGLAVELANYDKVYAAPLKPGDTLDRIFQTFNIDHPEDFKGHSLSVSDVVVMNRDGKETAFYIDSAGFKELPDFLTPKVQAQTIDLHSVADYLQKQYNAVQAADPNKTQGQAAFRIAVKRLDAVVEQIPGEHARIKVLLSHAAQSPDLAALKNRMESVYVNFIQHYSTAVQNTIDTSGKAEPKAPAASVKQTDTPPAQKTPAQGENVAAIEAKVKAGETINLSDLASAIKADKQVAQTAPQTQQSRTASRSKNAPAPEKPSIREELAAGKKQLSAQKSAPAKAAAQNKNKGLGD